MVFSIAYHFFHDPTTAEDVSQDVYLRLYQNLAAILSPEHMFQWLRQVTSRRCIDLARRNPARALVSLEDAPEPTADEMDSDPLLARKVRRVVAALPEDARMVLILRYQEDLALEEIAEILEIPINTVKSRLQRSLAHLRDRLESVGEISRHAGP